ncbi:MAG: DNA translocase FtsK [Opitutales bacterium]|nr:DNA translocase FtsK [Opitutales bacterium]
MPVDPDLVPGVRKIKSNLRRFLRRMSGEDVGVEEEYAPNHSFTSSQSYEDRSEGALAPEPEPTAEDQRGREKERRREEEETQLAAWRSEWQEKLSEKERRRGRDLLLREKSTHQVENLILSLERKQEELEEASEREDQVAEPELPEPPVTETEAEATVNPYTEEELSTYRRPTMDFLLPGQFDQADFIDEETLEQQKNLLQETLDSFAVDAYVCDALVGPRVTQFRVKPGYGVKVAAIANLEKNIALSMAVNAVRIQAPIPGEPFVGVEVPNPRSLTIRFRSAFSSPEWRESEAQIPLVMGMDMTGQILVTDLAKAPHMLIAGATGSGKSVCINNFLLSLLYRFRPDELELVLIDPKKVEFAMYKDIPHLIHPLVSEAKMAVGALKWLVREMEARYVLMAEKKVRNIAGFNARAEKEDFPKMPYIVLIIDEMADLMMTSKNEVEAPIARLAQMSRAVGIHTILATQRPSVNVITGVIKANYPSRAAFMVTSVVDSRTILDSKGAEALQGQGDMLFNPPGLSRLQRLQSPFVEDDEILKITDHLRETIPPKYRVNFKLEDSSDAEGSEAAFDGEMDPLLKQAVETVAASGRASTSFLQRKLKIGYNRAATLMEELEVRGYVGPQVGQNPREVLVEPGEFDL